MNDTCIEQDHRRALKIRRSWPCDDPEERFLCAEPNDFVETHRVIPLARLDSIDQRALASARARDLSSAPAVDFFYFGKPPRALFGAFHPPQTSTARGTAVLLCNPFGEEAVRAHRIYRVLALRLARSGHAVLRFDHPGTGDSSGDAEETSLEHWLEGIALATAELRARSRAPRIAALGLRLGATLAVLAAKKHPLDLHHLLLWDPVVEGPAYLRELAASHVEYMSDEMGSPFPPPQTTTEGYPLEALGHPLPAALVAELAQIDLAKESIAAAHATVLTTRQGDDTRRLEQHLASSKNTRWIATSTSVPWNSDAAVNSAIVPMDILEKLVARITEIDA
jgi:exosortase A-associated hydrolase 2